MTKNDIIEALYRDADIAKAIGKMQPVELQDDLRQEMFMVILETPDSKIMDMHAKGFLKFFLVRTMLNMIKSDRSTFYKVFRAQVSEWDDRHEQPDRPEPLADPEYTQRLGKAMDSLHWYEREIFKIYSETKNIVQISKETKIPYRSLFKTIKNTRDKLKQEMKGNKLIGEYIMLNTSIELDICITLPPEEMADLIEEVNEFIRSKIEGKAIGDAIITAVTGTKINKIC